VTRDVFLGEEEGKPRKKKKKRPWFFLISLGIIHLSRNRERGYYRKRKVRHRREKDSIESGGPLRRKNSADRTKLGEQTGKRIRENNNALGTSASLG